MVLRKEVRRKSYLLRLRRFFFNYHLLYRVAVWILKIRQNNSSRILFINILCLLNYHCLADLQSSCAIPPSCAASMRIFHVATTTERGNIKMGRQQPLLAAIDSPTTSHSKTSISLVRNPGSLAATYKFVGRMPAAVQLIPYFLPMATLLQRFAQLRHWRYSS